MLGSRVSSFQVGLVLAKGGMESWPLDFTRGCASTGFEVAGCVFQSSPFVVLGARYRRTEQPLHHHLRIIMA